MPLIEVPSIGVVEFPDSMSAQDIEKAIRENILKSKTTVGGYVKETLKAVPRGLVGGLEQAALGAAALLPGDTESGFEKTAREAIKGVAEKLKPTAAPGYEEAIPTKLGEAVGSMGSLIIPGGLGGMAARGLGLAARTGQMAAVAPTAAGMGAGEARERAVSEGATPEQIEKATMAGIAPGLLELAPIEHIFSKMPTEIKAGIFDRVKRAFVTGGMEGAQEAASAVAQNFIAQQVYKPSQELIEGVGEQAAYGAGAGAIVRFLLDAAIGRRAPSTKPTPTPTPTPAETPPSTAAEQTELPLEAPEQPPVTPQAAVAPSGREYTPEEIETSRMRAETAERKELEAAQVEDQIRELRSTYDILERERARLQAQYDALPVEKEEERTKLLEAGQSLFQQTTRLEEEIKALRKQASGLSRPGSPYAQREVAKTGQAAFDFETPVEAPAVETPAVETPAVEAPAPATPEKSLLEQAAEIVREKGGKIEAPVALVQNKLRLGYRTAAKLVSDLTKEGVLSPAKKGPGKTTYREVLPETPEVAPPAPIQLKEPKKRDRGTGDGREAGGEGAGLPVPQPEAGRGVAGTELGGVERAAQPAVLPAGGKKERTAALKKLVTQAKKTLETTKNKQQYNDALDFLVQHETPEKLAELAPATDIKEARSRVAQKGTPALRPSTGPTGPATGNTVEEIDRQVRKAIRDDSAIENITTVVQSEAQLPEAIRQSKDYKPGVRGVAYRGRVWLVADNIPQGRELGVFLHEAGAHIGFDKVLQPGQREQLANQVRNWAKGDDLKGKAAKVALAKGKDSNDEIIAYMVEELVNRGVKPVSFRPESTWLRRVLDAFKAALRKVGLMQDITPQELVDAAFGAAHIAAKTPVEEGLSPKARFGRMTPKELRNLELEIDEDSKFDAQTVIGQQLRDTENLIRTGRETAVPFEKRASLGVLAPEYARVWDKARAGENLSESEWLVMDELKSIYDNYARAMNRLRPGSALDIDRFLSHVLHSAEAVKFPDNTYVFGNTILGMFVPTHFAPATLRGGAESIYSLGQSNTMFVVTDDLATQLEKAGYYKVKGYSSEKDFRGEPVTKRIVLAPQSNLMQRLSPQGIEYAVPKVARLLDQLEQRHGYLPETVDDLARMGVELLPGEKKLLSLVAPPDIRFSTGVASITVDGKQRPTTNSNGQQIHPTEEGVINFWKWFGDSKVVDAEGRPLVMYHGTSKSFSVFDKKRIKRPFFGAGFHFAAEATGAAHYAGDQSGANITPVYLRVENPFDSGNMAERYLSLPGTDTVKSSALQAKGYDGITYFDAAGWTPAVVVFNPNQIKSAIGNTGAFSPASDDIRFSTGVASIITAKDKELFRGAPPAKNIVDRAIDAVAGKNLTDTLAKVMQRVRQNMASKYTYWEDYLTALEGNNARNAVGSLSGYDRVMASSKLAGLQQAVLEYGGFGRSPNGMWGAALDENGKFRVPNDNDPSLKKMYRTTYSMVGKYDGIDTADDARIALNMAAAARRESELIKEGLIGPKGEITRSLTDDQIERGLKLYNSMPEIREVLKTFKEINDRGLDALVKAGFMDAETAARYKKAVGYVPWFRFVVDKDGNVNVKALKQFSKGLVNYSAMKDLEGAKIEDIQIDDLLDNVARLSNWMVSKAIGNDTARYMVDAAMHGKQARRVGGFDTKGLDRAKTVQVFRNGEPEFYELTDPMAMAAFKGHETAHGALVGALSVPANVLRKGVTLFPAFPVAQLPQDSVRAFKYSGLKNPYAVFPRILKNFVKEAFGGTETSKILASRGIYGRGSGTAREEIRSRFAKELGVDRSLFAKGLEALEKWSDASDLAVRTTLYELTMEEGGNEETAFRRARDIINFDIQGASKVSSFLRQTVPFHGVWANDLNNLYKGLVLGRGRLSEGEAKQVRNAIIYRGMQFATLTALYTLAVGDEEDYKKLDDATRIRSLIIPGSNIRIPVPGDGIGFLFKVIPEEITRYMLANGIESDDAGAKFGKALFKGLESVGSFENFIPTGLKIPIEMRLNKSLYTDNPIVGMSKQNLEAYKQFTETTGAIAKEVGAALNVSPMKIEYFLRGLTGQIGGFVYGATNALFDALDNKVTPTKKWFEKPELRAFTYQTRDRASLDDFYEFREQVDKVARTYHDMIKAGRGSEAIEYLSNPQNQQTLALRQIQTKMDRDLSVFRQQRKLIHNNENLTADQMAAQLNELDERQSQYLRSMQLPRLRAIADVSSKSNFFIQKMFQ